MECMNAIHMMRVCEVEAFPFCYTYTRAVEQTLLKERCWIGLVATHVHQELGKWVKSYLSLSLLINAHFEGKRKIGKLH